jgi:hypothetical protein
MPAPAAAPIPAPVIVSCCSLLILVQATVLAIAIANKGYAIFFVTIQLTSDLPDSGVKSAHIHLCTARFILVLEQIRGNLNSYE